MVSVNLSGEQMISTEDGVIDMSGGESQSMQQITTSQVELVGDEDEDDDVELSAADLQEAELVAVREEEAAELSHAATHLHEASPMITMTD